MAIDSPPAPVRRADDPRPDPRPAPVAAARRLLPSDRYAIAVFAAMVLASVPLLSLTVDPAFLWLGTALAGVLCLAGLIARRFDLDPLIILGGQVLLLAIFVFAIAVTAGNSDLGVFARLPDLYSQGIQHMASQPVPMEPSAGVTLLFVTMIGAITIMTDHFVETVQRPVATLGPLITPYLITALVPTLSAPWWAFVSMAAGYLLILVAEGMNGAESWTRGISTDSGGRTTIGPIAWQLAALVGIPAIVLALVAAMALPVRDAGGNWTLAPPRGDAGPLQLNDPSQDLKRNLTQPEDRVVMVYQTTASDPEYLRMATLPRFDSQGFSGIPIQLNSGNDLPPPPGVADVPDPSVQTSIQIGELNSMYLPLPYPTDRFEAPGRWAYDPNSLTVLSNGDNREAATANLQYTVTSYPVEPDGAGLAAAEAGMPADFQVSGEVPADLPPELIELTNRVVGDAPTPALKAAAIQAYLRSDEFTYSLEPSDSDGYDALTQFLLEDKRGFCVQFAGSMAMMARVAGIPSRMAIGFLPGTKAGDSWEVTVRNMHAWPELYFEDYGWVRFEPTPGVAAPPPWSLTSNEGEGEEPDEPSATPIPEPAPEPTTSASPVPVPTPEDEVGIRDDLALIAQRVAAAAGVVLVLGLLAALPAIVRRRRKGIRMSAEGTPSERVEDAWTEVRDLVVDHGHDWPSSSPRDTGARIAQKLDDGPGQAMQRLSVLVERARFSRDYRNTDDPRPLVKRVEQGLQAKEDGRLGRLAARYWPRSVWHNFNRRR
ncbi:transglutaminase-like putative cysteine protease [Naumannella cuiyingiana]|uniref:Transglutaminase-like putative cysteine protease n=1 Tax=Naumannella cuiyingiana TaxID=1347891 RepID=A0A7Z0DB20_9ACTN|nr:DUF3488 and transglutaminase-like domain-containing protein [Naumannella cuiyingiana]NYI72087.1 transglutaminase-like putative cysteine protease [Naumannella cuiyingiana]